MVLIGAEEEHAQQMIVWSATHIPLRVWLQESNIILKQNSPTLTERSLDLHERTTGAHYRPKEHVVWFQWPRWSWDEVESYIRQRRNVDKGPALGRIFIARWLLLEEYLPRAWFCDAKVNIYIKRKTDPTCSEPTNTGVTPTRETKSECDKLERGISGYHFCQGTDSPQCCKILKPLIPGRQRIFATKKKEI